MQKAGWLDVWHLVVAVISRQPPFLAIVIVTGAVFFAVMALEGCRTSLLSIWRGHRRTEGLAPPAETPVALAAPAPLAARPAALPVSRSFSPHSVPRAAATTARKRKPLTVGIRNFRSPRPKIRRHPMLPMQIEAELPHYSADIPVLQHEGI
ncbi:MAG TPA: hypothetical protein VGB91_00110 [Rhizomicrobium sp.]